MLRTLYKFKVIVLFLFDYQDSYLNYKLNKKKLVFWMQNYLLVYLWLKYPIGIAFQTVFFNFEIIDALREKNQSVIKRELQLVYFKWKFKADNIFTCWIKPFITSYFMHNEINNCFVAVCSICWPMLTKDNRVQII